MNVLKNSILVSFSTGINAGILGGIGYACIDTVDKGLMTAVTAINNSKFAWYTRLVLPMPKQIGASGSGLTCALFVVIDTVIKKIFDLMLDSFHQPRDHKQSMFLRNIISLGLTAAASVALGLTSSLGVAVGVILASMAINALMLNIFSNLQSTWYA